MPAKRGRPRQRPEEAGLVPKLMSLKPETARAFDILKAEQGPRSGPRLAAEAIDLLLKKYGKQPLGWP